MSAGYWIARHHLYTMLILYRGNYYAKILFILRLFYFQRNILRNFNSKHLYKNDLSQFITITSTARNHTKVLQNRTVSQNQFNLLKTKFTCSFSGSYITKNCTNAFAVVPSAGIVACNLNNAYEVYNICCKFMLYVDMLS